MAKKDYKHIVLENSRHKDIRNGSTKRVKDDDMDATMGPMRNPATFEFRDRLNPLRRFLEKQVGRPWDKVYSELCQGADSRNIRGFHLRSHIEDTVVLNCDVVKTENGYRQRPKWYHQGNEPVLFGTDDLFVDDNGILRKPKKHERVQNQAEYKRAQAKKSRSFIKLTDTSAHILVSGQWYYVEWKKPEFQRNRENVQVLTPWFKYHMERCGKVLRRFDTEYRFIDQKDVKDNVSHVMRFNYDNPVLIYAHVKRQLNKKDVKNLGLAA